jgi:Uma2 family endonuclease
MAQTAADHGMTADELFLISSSDTRDELIRGVLVRMPPAGALHGHISVRVGRLLDEHVEGKDIGIVCGTDTGYILARSPDTVRAPDASFVARERIPAGGPPVKYWPSAPDLAVEVVSPSDRIDEVEEKIADYFAAGTRLVWVVHPRTQTVHTYRSLTDVRVLGPDDELDGQPVLPDFRCRVRRCFA